MKFRMNRKTWRRGAALAAAVIATTVGLVGCANGGGAGRVAAQDPDELTIALSTTLDTLDPAVNGNGDPFQIVSSLAYESLITMLPDGSFAPGLATSWGYVGNDNTVFELTLREGVKFSDGSDLTADSVKASLEHYGAAPGNPYASRIANMKSIDVTGPLSLQITLDKPNPIMEYLFSPRSLTGAIIGPTGIADPASLGTSTDGAGKYVLDAANTVTGQQYTFLPNEHYWDPGSVQFKKVTVKIIPDPNAQFQAMQSGEVDYIIGTPNTAAAAEKAGFVVTRGTDKLNMAMIFDRAGEYVPALGDQRVRQALNMAIDRDAVTQAIYGDNATPSDAVSVPGFDSYDESLEDQYPYDPEKAKQLLEEAGYGDGFSFDLIAMNIQPNVTDAAQALASEWQKIGVTANIVVPVDFADWRTRITTGNPEVLMFTYGMNPMQANGEDWFAGWANPYGVNDPTIDDLFAKAAAEPDLDARHGDYVELSQRLQDLAWFVPFSRGEKIVIARPGLEGAQVEGSYLDPNPALFTVAND